MTIEETPETPQTETGDIVQGDKVEQPAPPDPEPGDGGEQE